MRVVATRVQTAATMAPRWVCVALLYTFTTLLDFTGGQGTEDKRSRAVWYKARLEHTGSGLSDQQLGAIARQEDMQHFRKVLAPILVPRVVGTPGHERVRQHLVESMRELGWTVEEDSFDDDTPIGRRTFTNVVATLDPKAPRRLVLACHYDSKLVREGQFIGATDSAVPCAMMLNLAWVMKDSLKLQARTQSDLTLQFIFFDGEEAFRQWSKTDSIYGARHMAKSLEAQLYPPNNNIGSNHLHRMDLFILLDLLGTADVTLYNYFEETTPWYKRMASYERRLRELQLLHTRNNYIFQNQNLLNPGIEDDHIPFLHRGVPVLHLIPVPFPKVWHKNTDNERALHYGTIESLNKIMRSFVADYLHLII
ncbi:glutaminyl-peptide cyclotransferase-like [Eriocheir sinensis]|uniref:glutaminyl-peptide cyclotransferase-like n=1 Tax=Eriocheir sinensis TaxID=95602 RepID=UPI0021CAB6ED|nr:glutaminyl-peptide cyclotransferase-like [Eriocheir sinensis]